MNEILKITDLNVFYQSGGKKRHVLRDVSLSLQKGEIRAIVGESGCGKSTLVNALIALLPDNAEVKGKEILLDDQNVLDLNRKQWRQLRSQKIGVVFQDPFSALDPLYTVRKQAEETLKINRKITEEQAEARIEKMLSDCGLRNAREIMERYPFELSGGQMQRVMIAMALLNGPELLIADEPTTALDVTVQKEILDLLKKLAREREMAVLFVTHSLDVAAEIADGISVFYGGQVMEEAGTEELFHFPRHPYTQALLKTIPSLDYGKKERRLMPIEGELFSFLDENEGCVFAPRCPYSQDKCRQNMPEMKKMNKHSYRCINEEKL